MREYASRMKSPKLGLKSVVPEDGRSALISRYPVYSGAARHLARDETHVARSTSRPRCGARRVIVDIRHQKAVADRHIVLIIFPRSVSPRDRNVLFDRDRHLN